MTAETEKNPVGNIKSVALPMQAMALNIPNKKHPNKMPFSGILTRIGAPSDSAPDGSEGKRVMITAEAATKALDSLLGMAVDYQPDFDGHDPQAKIGIITAADIDGDAITVKGFIYAADFPDIAAQIKENKSELGMSFEARDLWTNDADADPMPIVDCVFTGAAILFKEKAAYKTTSIAAKSAKNEDFIMNEDTKKQLAESVAEAVAAAIKPVADAVAAQAEQIKKIEQEKIEAANHLAKVERHAAELEKAADHMDAAGIGGDADRGHTRILRDMAGDLRAQAAQGRIPAAFYSMRAAAEKAEPKVDTAAEITAAVDKAKGEFTAQLAEVKAAAEKSEKELADKLAAAETKLADVKAAAEKAKAETGETTPARKTLSPVATQLLAKGAIEMPKEGEKLDLAKIDSAIKNLGLSVDQRFQFKTELHNAGLID